MPFVRRRDRFVRSSFRSHLYIKSAFIIKASIFVAIDYPLKFNRTEAALRFIRLPLCPARETLHVSFAINGIASPNRFRVPTQHACAPHNGIVSSSNTSCYLCMINGFIGLCKVTKSLMAHLHLEMSAQSSASTFQPRDISKDKNKTTHLFRESDRLICTRNDYYCYQS